MKQCKCPNCGAAINIARRICEYCGTTFKEELEGPLFNQEIRYVVARPGVKTLRMGYEISEMDVRHFGEDFLEPHIRREIANEMANKIMDEIQLECNFDVRRMNRSYRATVRVLDPSFRF